MRFLKCILAIVFALSFVGPTTASSEKEMEQTESDLLKSRPKTWRKFPDMILAEVLKHRSRWKKLREDRKKKSQFSNIVSQEYIEKESRRNRECIERFDFASTPKGRKVKENIV